MTVTEYILLCKSLKYIQDDLYKGCRSSFQILALWPVCSAFIGGFPEMQRPLDKQSYCILTVDSISSSQNTRERVFLGPVFVKIFL